MTNWYEKATLPRFAHPPVSETALAVEFAPVPGYDFIRLSQLQERWRDEYPTVIEQPGAPPSQLAREDNPAFSFNLGVPPRRVWASAPGTGKLIQTQTDRLILNWRKDDASEPYPGYFESMRGEYVRLWGIFNEFLNESGLSAPSPFLAEFVYVNVVPLGERETLTDVLTLIREPKQAPPGRDVFGSFSLIREVTETVDDPYPAQIQISGNPIAIPEGRAIMFTISAKVPLTGDADPMGGLDAAHALASHTFARIVTDSKREAWEQIQ